MEKNLIIHKVGVEDISTIIKLAKAVWPSTYKDILSPEQLEYMMELFYSEDSLKQQFVRNTFIVAYLDNEAVGFASYSPASEGTYKLQKLYVNTAIQGRGLGKALINFITDDILPLGGKILELNVNRHNKAKSFYEKIGFAVAREEDIDIGLGYWMNDYVMRKFL